MHKNRSLIILRANLYFMKSLAENPLSKENLLLLGFVDKIDNLKIIFYFSYYIQPTVQVDANTREKIQKF